MKKLFIITSFLTLFFCFLSVDAQEPENINVKNKHYYPSFSDCFYDINTFKYDGKSTKKCGIISIFAGKVGLKTIS